MKKAIVLLLALAVLGGALFAQDAPVLKFDGYVSTGVFYNVTQDQAKLYNYYNSGKPDRVRFNANYTDGTFGLKFRLQSNDFTAPTVTQALVRAGFFDNMLVVKAGKLDDYSMATYDNSYGTTDGAVGAQFYVKPIDALTIAYFLPIKPAVYNSVADEWQFATTEAGLAHAVTASMVGASYSLEGIGSFLLGGHFFESVADTYFQFDLSAVENVGFTVEVYNADLSAIDPAISFDTSYTMDKLVVELYGNLNTFTGTMFWLAEPMVYYSVTDKVTVGADFTYDSTDAYDINGNIKYAMNGKSTLRAKAGYDGTDTYIATSLDFYF